MNPDELREIMEFLRRRVHLEVGETADGIAVRFEAPSVADMVAAGLHPEGSRSILSAPWWDEMVTDVVETPEMCEPEDTAEEVLAYARDVVSEYVRKRATL
jgi:peptide subunit release factor 1 (eRF1)